MGHREFNDPRGSHAGAPRNAALPRRIKYDIPPWSEYENPTDPASSSYLYDYQDGPANFGPHIGKGPKNYKRSPEATKDQVCSTLERHGLIDASHIEVDVEHGVVTLRGTVRSRAQKRLAEDCADVVSGVDDVNNRLSIEAHV
jgi:hypothetical protein